jgi:hypothetical protein
MRRVLTAIGAGLGAAAAVALVRRRGGGRRAHVDLYFADGSMVSLPADAPAAARLLPVARELLAAARGT